MTPNTKQQVEYSHPATDGARGSKITLCGITIAAGSWGTEEQADAMGVEYTDCPDCAAMKHLEEEIAKAALEDGGAGTLFVILAAIALTKLAEFISAKRRSSSATQHYRDTPEHHNHKHRHSDATRMPEHARKHAATTISGVPEHDGEVGSMTDRGNVITLTPKNRKKPTPRGNRGGGSLAATLDQATDWINKYSVHLTEHEARVMALWAAHTWVSEAFYVTPRIIFSSATPQSGKTRQLELLENITCSPERTENDTPAVLFRSIEKGHEAGHPPTILFDETDAMFNGSGDSKQEELRGIANSGYKKGGRVRRCVGPDNELKVFHTFAPVAFAGIAGNMPDTITTRAVTVEMRKRKPGEAIEPYYIAKAAEESAPMRQWFAQWVDTPGLVESLEFKHPSLPPGVEDRPAEVWTALMVIAELAGEHWPGWASEACEYFVRRPSMEDRPKNVRLLDDIRTVMHHTTAIRSSDLCSELRSLEDAEWSQMGEAGIRPHDLSRMLRPFGVAPATVRQGAVTFKGYTVYPTEQNSRAQVGLQDAWDRHLPLVADEESGNSRNVRNSAGERVADRSSGLEQQRETVPVSSSALNGTELESNGKDTGQLGLATAVTAVTASPVKGSSSALNPAVADTINAMVHGDATPAGTIATQRGIDTETAREHLEQGVQAGQLKKVGKLYTRI